MTKDLKMNAIIHHAVSLSNQVEQMGVSLEDAAADWWSRCDQSPEAAEFLAACVHYAKNNLNN